MTVLLKKTNELSDKEIEKFCQLFNEVFLEAQLKTIKTFKEMYLNTAQGYSYHSLMYFKEELVGARNTMPMDYIVDGKKIIIGVGADFMIKEGYRSLTNLMKLIKFSEESLLENGIVFDLGLPNKNAHTILNRVFQYKDIGNLKTYVLPYRVGGIKPGLKYFNWLSILVVNVLFSFSKLRKSYKTQQFLVDKNRDKQAKYRYKWFGADYKMCQMSEFSFIYRILTKDGIRTAFLIDIDKLNPQNITTAVRYILKVDKKSIDLIMYVGYLTFNPFPLLKIPKRVEPKKFNFHGKFLDLEKHDDRFFNIENWNINLSCYDLL